ncbi:MAG: heme utilization protein [Hyphococcus sp.]|nr:MAG: heme utilization protein [Marinicaulis sp.]
MLCASLAALCAFATAARAEERLAPGEIRAEAVDEKRIIPPVLIRGVKFEGVDVPANVADAVRPFLARTATRQSLNDLAVAMNRAYAASGVAFYSIAIPPQSFANGVVRVRVTEGAIKTISYSGETEGRKHQMVTAYAERLTAETTTRRATLERTVALTRDIPGLIVEPTLHQGDAPGEVRMEMALDYQKPTVTFGFNNRTTRLVRDGQFSAIGKAYRLLRDGDATSLRLAASVNFKDSLQASLTHSTPIGTSGVRAEASAAILRSNPSGTPVSGDAQLYGVAVTAPVIRSFKRNLLVRAGLDGVNSDNAAFGSLIATERTRAARLSATYSAGEEKLSYRLHAGVAQGIDMLGAEVTPAIGEPQYTKLTAEAGLTKHFGKSVYVRLNSGGQWTDNFLPANERFSMGGPRFGRAFDTALVNADRGFGMSIEPAWRPISGGDFSKSEVYVFADYVQGDVFSRSGGDTIDIDMGSFGAGLRAAYDDIGVLEVEFARAYNQPVPGFDQDWRFSIGWRIDIKP